MTFLQTFLFYPVEYFLEPNFCVRSWKPCRKNPCSWRCLVVPRTRNLSYYLTGWKRHSVWTPNGTEQLRWFEIDFFGCEIVVSKITIAKKKKEHTQEDKTDVDLEVEQEVPLLLVAHLNNILHSFFYNVEVYINSQQIYNSNCWYVHKSYISNNFKLVLSGNMDVLHWGRSDYEEFLYETMDSTMSDWADPISSRCMVHWGLSLSPFLNCCIQTWKLGSD